jgi:hypothetical protein
MGSGRSAGGVGPLAEILAGLWSTAFMLSLTLPRSSTRQHLDLHLVADIDDIAGL